jgi:hypothetical protein
MAVLESYHLDRRAELFPAVGTEGDAGVVVQNIERESATVTFTAHDAEGKIVAETTMQLEYNAKLVGCPDEIFDVDISEAVFMRYESDKSLVGFQVNGSRDGTMLGATPHM